MKTENRVYTKEVNDGKFILYSNNISDFISEFKINYINKFWNKYFFSHPNICILNSFRKLNMDKTSIDSKLSLYDKPSNTIFLNIMEISKLVWETYDNNKILASNIDINHLLEMEIILNIVTQSFYSIEYRPEKISTTKERAIVFMYKNMEFLKRKYLNYTIEEMRILLLLIMIHARYSDNEQKYILNNTKEKIDFYIKPYIANKNKYRTSSFISYILDSLSYYNLIDKNEFDMVKNLLNKGWTIKFYSWNNYKFEITKDDLKYENMNKVNNIMDKLTEFKDSISLKTSLFSISSDTFMDNENKEFIKLATVNNSQIRFIVGFARE